MLHTGAIDLHVVYVGFGGWADLGVFLEVIPVPVVHPLSQQLNRRLGSVHLSGWHVQVIHKHNLCTEILDLCSIHDA